MTIQLHNPAGVSPPFSCYSHGASASANARWLHVSGQVDATPDGTVSDDPEKQIQLAWDNLLAVLQDAGMTTTDLVKVDGFITRPDLVPFFPQGARAALRRTWGRNHAGHRRWLGGARFVSGNPGGCGSLG